MNQCFCFYLFIEVDIFVYDLCKKTSITPGLCSLHLSPVPVIEKRLMEVKLGEIGTWVGGRDFTPNGMFSSVRKGEEICSDFLS